MPKNPRQDIKQRLQGAMNDLQRAADKIVIVAQPYEEPHPDYYQSYCEILAAVIQLKDALQVMSDNT